MTTTSAGQASEASSALVEISNAMVRLYKEAFGRGPTKTRARFSGADTLVVLLEDTLTAAERSLIALGEHGRVRDERLLLHLAFEDLKRSEVERILTRRPVVWVCGIDPLHDLATEVCTFESAPV